MKQENDSQKDGEVDGGVVIGDVAAPVTSSVPVEVNVSELSTPRRLTEAEGGATGHIQRKREETASEIAILVVQTFKIAVILCFVPVLAMAVVYVAHHAFRVGTSNVSEARVFFDVFERAAAFIAGPLGFVMGFYFRSVKD